jgi:hypothetical protein
VPFVTPRPDLRDLDRRVVPVAARALRRLLDRAELVRGRADRQARRGSAAASAAVRQIDDRALASGPLAVLRDVPQLALLVVAAVLLSGTAAAVLLDEPDPTPATPAASSSFGQVTRLGVPPGGDVELYLAQSRVVLDDLARRLPVARLFAVVHLSRYVEAAQVPALLEGTDPERVYLRASSAGPDAEIVAVPVQAPTLATVLPALCTATSQRKAEDAANFTTLADSVAPQTREEQLSRNDFQSEAVRAQAESQAYAGACAASFAAVVEAPAAVLRELVDRDGVRGVEPAPAGIDLAELDVQPLLPETTGIVPTGRER